MSWGAASPTTSSCPWEHAPIAPNSVQPDLPWRGSAATRRSTRQGTGVYGCSHRPRVPGSSCRTSAKGKRVGPVYSSLHGLRRRRPENANVHSLGRGWICSADRLRQYRRTDAGKNVRALARAGGAKSAWGKPLAFAAPHADGKPGPVAWRIDMRPGRGLRVYSSRESHESGESYKRN